MGRLIVLDGLDGSGKSTQLERLCGYLNKIGERYRQISFPDYDQPSSALVKMYLAGEFGMAADDVNAYAASSFYAVDRFSSYKKFWKSDYESDTLILAARYTTSNAIHQMAKLPETEWNAYLEWLQDYEYRLLGLPRPDLVIFLDMPPMVSQRLMSRRYAGDESRKDIHERNVQYMLQCRKSALAAAARCGWTVIPCADGETPLNENTITDVLIRQLKPFLTAPRTGETGERTVSE